MHPAQVEAKALDIAFAVGHPCREAVFWAQTVIDPQRGVAHGAVVGIDLTNTRAVGQGLVGIAGVQPAAVVACDHTARAVAVEALQIHPGTLVIGLGDVGIQVGPIGNRPVQRGAVLHAVLDLARRQAEHQPRVQQVVDRAPGRQFAVLLIIPVAQQLALAPRIQVVAQTLIRVTPVAGLVNQFFSARGDLAIFHQAHLHLINTARQYAGIDTLQPRTHGLAIDQYIVAIDFHCRFPIRGHENRVNRRLAPHHFQRIGTAHHHPQRSFRTCTNGTWLTVDPDETRGEVAQAEKIAIALGLAVQLIHRVFQRVVVYTAFGQLRVEGLRPLPQAATRLNLVAAIERLLLPTDQVQLVAPHQSAAAAHRKTDTRWRIDTLGTGGKNRQQRTFQTVMHGLQTGRAVNLTGAEGQTVLHDGLPLLQLGGRHLLTVAVRKINQHYPLIAGQCYQRLPHKAPIQLNAHGKRHIKEMIGKTIWQLGRLQQQGAGRRHPAGNNRMRVGTQRQRQRHCQWSHTKHSSPIDTHSL